MGILNPIFWAIHIHKSQHIFSTFFLTVFEVALLAKDGIYINDFPRFIQHVSLPPGGRAELAVRCPRVGDVDTEHQVRREEKRMPPESS